MPLASPSTASFAAAPAATARASSTNSTSASAGVVAAQRKQQAQTLSLLASLPVLGAGASLRDLLLRGRDAEDGYHGWEGGCGARQLVIKAPSGVAAPPRDWPPAPPAPPARAAAASDAGPRAPEGGAAGRQQQHQLDMRQQQQQGVEEGLRRQVRELSEQVGDLTARLAAAEQQASASASAAASSSAAAAPAATAGNHRGAWTLDEDSKKFLEMEGQLKAM